VGSKDWNIRGFHCRILCGVKNHLDRLSSKAEILKRGDFQMSGLNRYLIEDLIEDYQKLNTNPETTTVDAGIVLEDAKGLPLILSVKATTPPCDVDALTKLLDKHTRQRAAPQLIGKVFCDECKSR
jgi:hypothetical protein